MSIRNLVGSALSRLGYKMAADYRWPEVNGNLVEIGMALLRQQGRDPIHLIQVGAFDGLAYDPLFESLQFPNVRAVLVEPQSGPFEELQRCYGSNPRITLLNAAVAPCDGRISLWVPGSVASPKASININHCDRFGIPKSQIREVLVQSISVPTLLQKAGYGRVDLLQIDTEGMDFEILKMFFDANVMPQVINFESLHLTRSARLESRRLLKDAGYYYIDTAQDTLALHEDLVKN